MVDILLVMIAVILSPLVLVGAGIAIVFVISVLSVFKDKVAKFVKKSIDKYGQK